MIQLRGFILARAENLGEEVALRPNDAVYGLAGRAPYRADGKALGRLLDVAIVAFRATL